MSVSESCYIVCRNLTEVFRAEKILRAAGIAVSPVPAPPAEAGPCTTVLELTPGEVRQAVRVLGRNGVEIVKTFVSEPKRHRLAAKVTAGRQDTPFAQALTRVLQGEVPATSAVAMLLQATGEDAEQLRQLADRVRRSTVGDVIDIRAVIEFSSYCRRNCLYCGLRKANKAARRYRMTGAEIVSRAVEIARLGIKTVILQSGEDNRYTTEKLVEIIREIKKKTGMRITLSLGERDLADYRTLKEAGADNYLLKVETTDERLYARLHPGMTLVQRVRHIRAIKKEGYITGSGNITGLPGQETAGVARDILWFRREGIHMIGTGPFIPAPGTPLEKHPPGSAELALNTIAATRLLCPHAYIPATTALATLDRKAQLAGLACGANTVMLTMTPPGLREKYAIYGNKNVVDLPWAVQMAGILGRQVPPAVSIEGGSESARHTSW